MNLQTADSFGKWVIEEVRKFIRDLPGENFLGNTPEGLEFKDEEILNAMRTAQSAWANILGLTIFVPPTVFGIPEINMEFIRLVAGYLFLNKTLHYARNTYTVGDVVMVSDIEQKAGTYPSIGMQLIQSALSNLRAFKARFFSSGYTIDLGGTGGGGNVF